MADEATVTLSATDQISAPTLKAVASLQQLQAAIEEMAGASRKTQGSAASAASATNEMAEAANRSVVPHRAASQAMNLVSSGLLQVSGAAPEAAGAMRVLDSILMTMAVGGGAVSLMFIGITAAVVGAVSIFKHFSTEASTTNKELSAMVDKMGEASLAVDHLTTAQRGAAAAAAAVLQPNIIAAETAIGKLNQQLEASRTKSVQAAQGHLGFKDTLLAAIPFYGNAENASRKYTAEQIDLMAKTKAASANLEEMKRKFNELTAASAGAGAGVRSAINTSAALSEAVKNSNAEIDRQANAMAAYYKKIDDFSTQTKNIVLGAFANMAVGVGEVIGEMIATGEMNWKKFLLVVVDSVLMAAQQIVMAWMAVSQFMNVIIPGWGGISITAGILALAAIGVLRGVAHSMLGGGGASKAASSAASSGASAASTGAVGEGAGTGAGGTAVSSAQQSLTNNIVVNIPIQALDLSAISDMQLKSLSNRIGRVMAEASGHGQFSLVGA